MLVKAVRWVCTLLEVYSCLTITAMQREMAAHCQQEAGGATILCALQLEM